MTAPVLDVISPETADYNSEFQMSLEGSQFIDSSIVEITLVPSSGAPQSTVYPKRTYINSANLEAEIDTTVTHTPGRHIVRVKNDAEYSDPKYLEIPEP